MPTTTVYVCTTCRSAGEDPEPRDARAGARLHAALAEAAREDADIDVVGVECLSVCKRPVTVGFASAGKWTYVYGDFAPGSAEALIEGARLFGKTADGLIPWKERPDGLKRGVIARIPPRYGILRNPSAIRKRDRGDMVRQRWHLKQVPVWSRRPSGGIACKQGLGPRMSSPAEKPGKHFALALGTERFGLLSLRYPFAVLAVFVLLGIAAAFGVARLKVDDSLSQLFRSDTPRIPPVRAGHEEFPLQRI